jgi:hypothetical protein
MKSSYLEIGNLYQFNLNKLNGLTLFETKKEYNSYNEPFWRMPISNRRKLKLDSLEHKGKNNPYLLLIDIVEEDENEDLLVFFYEGVFYCWYVFHYYGNEIQEIFTKIWI